MRIWILLVATGLAFPCHSGESAVAACAHGSNALWNAVNCNDTEAVRALLAAGVDPDHLTRDLPLLTAAGRDTRIVALLLAAGADPNQESAQFRYTALTHAAGSQPDTFARLIAAGRYNGPAPDSAETVRLLLAAGANVNHVDQFGNSALRRAILANNLEIARQLLEAHADVHQRWDSKGQSGDTILMAAITRYLLHKDIRTLRLLLDFGANPNDRNELEYSKEIEDHGANYWRGYSVLGYAAREGLYEVVHLLLRHGANPLLPRTDGALPASIAKDNHHRLTASLIETYVQGKEP